LSVPTGADHPVLHFRPWQAFVAPLSRLYTQFPTPSTNTLANGELGKPGCAEFLFCTSERC
jgi:hypothetical protein